MIIGNLSHNGNQVNSSLSRMPVGSRQARSDKRQARTDKRQARTDKRQARTDKRQARTE